MLFKMPFNYRNINSFSDYNCLENIYLRANPTLFVVSHNGFDSESVQIARTFQNDSYFDFVRFFNLTNFIFGYHKALVVTRTGSFFLTRIFRSKFLYFLLRNLFKFRKTSKGSFLVTCYFDNDTGFIKIREPHVAFSVTSSYFDYHSSKLNLNFSFNYKKNPRFLAKLTWMFGFLRYLYMKSRQHIFKKVMSNIVVSGPLYFCFKTIVQNQHLDLFFRYFSFYRYISKGGGSFSTKLKPICIVSGRSRGLVNSLYFSRLVFKEYASRGNLCGFKKSQW